MAQKVEGFNAETWLPIEGYEDLYEVSDLGRVRSLDREREQMTRHGVVALFRYRGRVLRQILDAYGYPFVGLYGSACRRDVRKVHRLVAAAFVPNPNRYPEVNHKDFNRSNAAALNLEWVSSSGNRIYSAKALRLAKKLTPGAALAIRTSQDDRNCVAVQNGVALSTVYRIQRGESWGWL